MNGTQDSRQNLSKIQHSQTASGLRLTLTNNLHATNLTCTSFTCGNLYTFINTSFASLSYRAVSTSLNAFL